MKHLILTITLAGLALAQDAKQPVAPKVPALELAELKLAASQAQNIFFQGELLKGQYIDALKEAVTKADTSKAMEVAQRLAKIHGDAVKVSEAQQRLQAELELKFGAIYTKAGAKREEYDLDAEKGVFVKKPAENAKK